MPSPMWLSKLAENITLALKINKGSSRINKTNNTGQILDNSPQSNTQVNQVQNLQINQGRPNVEEKMLTILEKVVDQNQMLLAFQDTAKLKALQRNKEFKDAIEGQTANLSVSEMTKLEEPDAQAILSEASLINARTSSNNLRSILANLVIKRIKDDTKGQEELKNVVYNEAIRTIPKLTNNELKILTLHYLLTQVIMGRVASWDSFNEFLNATIKPLLDFRNTDSEFQHIVYSGTGSISLGSWDIVSIISSTYTFLFLRPTTVDDLQSLDLSAQTIQSIIDNFFKDRPIARNKGELEKIVKKISLSEDKQAKLLELYESRISSTGEVRTLLIEKTDIGAELLKTWDDTPLNNLSLTSVGVAIAMTNYEQISGQSLNADLWIN